MKLEIIAGREWSALFTVVSDDGITGEPLVATDTATFTLSHNGVTPLCVLENIPMTQEDPLNGVFKITLTPVQTADLIQLVGFGEDNYPTMSNYISTLDFFLEAGDRTATADIYVREIGSCTVA